MDEQQMEALKRAFEIINECIARATEIIKDASAYFAEIAEEMADIPPPRKLPRPPKRTGPVNKANYTANRPPRVARSTCRKIRR